MASAKKKNKLKGVIGTILFHLSLIVIFLFTGLTYQDPPPKEEGISIDFGFNDSGIGEIEPENTEETNEISEEELIEEQIENNEKVITQSVEKIVELNDTKKEKINNNDKTKVEIIDEKKPEINIKALYNGSKKNKDNKKNNQGKNDGLGNEGTEQGDLNSNSYLGGGIGIDGMAYQLGGRNAIEKPKPEGNQIEGKVVVLITVNRLGEVIYANAGAMGSTTYNKKLLERAKQAALKTKFDTKESAPQNQQGKIIYDFKLN